MSDGTTATIERSRSEGGSPVASGWHRCSTCGGSIRRETGRCPHCSSRTRRWWVNGPGVVVGLVVVLAVGWAVGRRLAARHRDR